MSTRPVLGIIACNRMVGTEVAQAVMNRYATAAMQYADCAALIIPSLPDYMRASEVVGRLDGVLLTGTPSNVEPARYGDADAGEGPFDPDRDRMMIELVDAVIAAQRPLFGICRGFQEINVALGGTLRRDTSASAGLLLHHAPDGVSFDGMFDHRHRVDLAAGGVLATAYDAAALEVNSVHYQGIGALADGLQVEARAPDGLIEAYSARPNGAPLLAVQWHPEWATDDNAESQTYFRLLGRALRGEL
ncbi:MULTISPECIES: gamma-glutamyl-gamma-aminobutyrate hydrolase family protein [unclassified Sphingopyxis]|uniref:gamma-glutamyl-gamma-aminobutyrate hydrolase family protein n=1 Tax=unclassified Sphingopyxis TaxID=2614943 RepID=UPI002865401A|nr:MULTISPECIES: gamma-glutamyl-gamma-aminobutyrate hydrolase family protein [unclassified Sphingopyxis]MDR6831883.1 putative glutamine amidotransferase [Sphingopyxis sp. BE122]MDR7227625.1 putative glutamine amidotransferase [Sphingopyxis sp. BE259]